MQHEMIPLFSVPLIKMNIGEMDQVSRAWIRGLDYPSQRTGTDHSDDDLPMMNRGMKILDRPQLKDLKYKIQNAKHVTQNHFPCFCFCYCSHTLLACAMT